MYVVRGALVITGASLLALACAGGPDGTSPTSGPPVSSSPPDAGSDAPSVIVVSHVSVEPDPSAPDLSGITEIDTTLPSLTPAPADPPPFFVIDDKAVLFVGALTIDEPLRVTGSRPLIVVASRAVKIEAAIDAAAQADTPGPGGAGPGAGPGKGADAKCGGGGAGMVSAGGDSGPCTLATDAPKSGGKAHASPAVLVGGSGGGAPLDSSGKPPSGSCSVVGGAGGGALQFSSLVSIEVTGSINVGGGGGGGGCPASDGSGGGGGSGGMVFLEAPTIHVSGEIFANGGGGGGGGYAGGDSAARGAAGADGSQDTRAAAGGNGALRKMNDGGNGGALDLAPTAGLGDDHYRSGGGGGGAAGLIVLRTRGNPGAQPGTFSPEWLLDPTY